ncbi:unnamed protein product [Protopolystoma xenopodis]|uniref:RAD51 interacting motif domain-containing protein n=1 Tax=Protopolystoma xenopodis TaxID=117903 RepID=A0A448X7J5_9PLAT|nr:unnamed protein product [Protopolystoma xenopodis]
MGDIPKKRQRKAVNYAKLDGNSDEDFFDDISPPKKMSMKAKVSLDEETWKPDDGIYEIKSKVPKNKPKEKSKNKDITAINISKSVVHREVISTSRPKSSSVSESTSVSCKSLAPASIDPLTSPKSDKLVNVVSFDSSTVSPPLSRASLPTPSARANALTPPTHSPLYPVTPNSGLRLGLSRRGLLKSLHSNIRITR